MAIEEHISHLKIAMDYIVFGQVEQSLEDVLYKGLCSGLVKIAFFAQLGLQVTFPAQFSDDVAIVCAREHFEALEHVRVVQSF